MPPEKVYLFLKSNENDLSEQGAQRRLKTYGYNELENRRLGRDPILLRQFKSSLFAILIGCAVILGFFTTIDQASVRTKLVRLLTVANIAR